MITPLYRQFCDQLVDKIKSNINDDNFYAAGEGAHLLIKLLATWHKQEMRAANIFYENE